MFKPKPKKKIDVDKNSMITIDNKHSEILENIQQEEEIELPKLQEKKKELQKQILVLKEQENTIEKILELEDEVNKIKKNISKIKREKKKYLLDNSKYIFDYFEKKKEISEGTGKKRVLNSFFNKEEPNKKIMINDNNKYLSNVDINFLEINDFIVEKDRCSNCKGELIPIDYEGVKICNKCGKQETYLIQHEKPSYKEPPKEVCFYAYRRINHFKEILSQFQAKETTQIPDEVIEKIKLQITKQIITLTQLTNKKTKYI